MPFHPTEACYCHVIEAGLLNLERHNRTGDTQLAANELEHLRGVTEILTATLLYTKSDPRHDASIHDRYWNEVRPRFLAHADQGSREHHAIAWEFLAMATRGSDFRDSLINKNGLENA